MTARKIWIGYVIFVIESQLAKVQIGKNGKKLAQLKMVN